jgi:hypothetical protein
MVLASYKDFGNVLSLRNRSSLNNEKSLSTNMLLHTFNNKKMVARWLMGHPSYNGVLAFLSIYAIGLS